MPKAIDQPHSRWRLSRPANAHLCHTLALLIAVIVMAAGGVPAASAQSSPDSTLSRLQNTINTLEARDDLEPAVRERALDLYRQARTALQAAADLAGQTQALGREAEQAPQTLAQVERELEQIAPALTLDEAGGMSSDALIERRNALEAGLAATGMRLADLRDELARLAQRPDEARDELAQARTALQQIDTAFEINTGQPEVLDDAQLALAAAQREALRAEIEYLEQELAGLDRRQRLIEAQRARVEERLERDNQSLAVVQLAFARRQNESAQALRADAKTQASRLDAAAGVIAQAAERNAELAQQLTQATRRGEQLAMEQAQLRARVEDVQRRFNLVQRQLEIGGRSIALGDVLQGQRRNLVAPGSAMAADDVPNLAAAELSRFQLQQDLTRLEDVDMSVERLAGGALPDAAARATLVDLIETRQQILDPLIAVQGRFIETGRELRLLADQYQDTVEASGELLDERLFWLPSFEPVGWGWFARLAAALPEVLQPGHWQQVLMALGDGARQASAITALGLAFFALLMALQRRLRRELHRCAEPIGNVSRDNFWLTLRALAATALLCLPWALLLGLAGYLIGRASEATAFALAAGVGLIQLAHLTLFVEPFRQVCRPSGLAESHFQWSDEARQGLRVSLRVLLFALAVPPLFVSLTETPNDDGLRETIGRATFIFGSLTLAWFAWRLLHPARGVLADVLGGHGEGHWRLGYIWLPLAAGVPLVLAALALWGYYYTSLQLQSRFVFSAGLLGTSIILYSLIVRWLTVAERRLALARARAKREQAREARAAREAAAAAGGSAPDNLDQLEIDLVQITAQTRGLIKVVVSLMAAIGLWLLWSDMLPALSLLNNVSLWQYASEVDGGATEFTQVTLGALLLALVVGVVTALAGRNLPGFLEITVLRRFSFDSGSRYAMATLFQYAIVATGLLVAVSLIGFSWSSIQWLVAAIGLGLGFGLQEIFANFVSGIVILFERPVRVGDTVTVGNLFGTVSRIRIRATTITDWDNKEIIIPNKTFITETVINWTLTDNITRLIVRVSVTRDADSDLAAELIAQAIKAEPTALTEPAPSVFIVGFEDGLLVFEARVFFNDLYYLLPLQHALYTHIKDAFAENDIEISFPQQGLHLRSMDESVRSAFSAGRNGSDAESGA